jgi:hypothetical protein
MLLGQWSYTPTSSQSSSERLLPMEERSIRKQQLPATVIERPYIPPSFGDSRGVKHSIKGELNLFYDSMAGMFINLLK